MTGIELKYLIPNPYTRRRECAPRPAGNHMPPKCPIMGSLYCTPRVSYTSCLQTSQGVRHWERKQETDYESERQTTREWEREKEPTEKERKKKNKHKESNWLTQRASKKEYKGKEKDENDKRLQELDNTMPGRMWPGGHSWDLWPENLVHEHFGTWQYFVAIFWGLKYRFRT